MSPEILAAIIAGFVALLGYPAASLFGGWSERRAKQHAFRLECYQDFLKSFFELAARGTFEAQLAFVHKVNVMNLMASTEVMKLVGDLATNYTNEDGSEAEQWQIINRVIWAMRCDVTSSDLHVPMGYEFPFIVTDIPPTQVGTTDPAPEGERPRRQKRNGARAKG